ncbi:glycoside hydrolase superfamily [Plectosphaerella plurivora]|uniref:beta-glucosidase n=1 Tax=Plectosphaerella plurivora TaxID=936078 RepID=A0A9P9A6H8_9PEZI|nr:glycoside hydrolase superfamily [Plectosphaerella plurivora]
MTLEEKVSLLTGKDMWRTNGIPRLGIPMIKTSDGPVGVRGSTFVDGLGAAQLPMGCSLAATWDLSVLQSVSQVLIDEAKNKGSNVLLDPTVCIPRTPLGGRNYESYSEDPFLTGKIAATFISSLQDAGVGACIKHFAANDQEERRFFINANMSERALREIACQPFQIAVRESDPWTVMTAYNKVNGQYSSGNTHLLGDILRGEWAWDGLVMSDWFGTNSMVPSLEAGLDLEMPGPVRRRGQHLLKAHAAGLVDTRFIDESAGRVLELIHKCGKGKMESLREGEEEEESSDKPEHRAILRKAGAQGIVLLKNSTKLLPLEDLHQKSVAFIGPNAARGVQSGGGSANLQPHYRTTPVDSFKQAVAEKKLSVTIETAPGIIGHRYLPLIDASIMRNPDNGTSGFSLSLWNNMTHSGPALATEHRPSSNLVCYDQLPAELTTGYRYSYRGRTVLTPKTSGTHQFSLSTCGPGRLIVGGKVIIDIPRSWDSPKSALFMSYGSPEERVCVDMVAGQEYEVVLESVSREPKPYEMTYTGDLEREEIQDGGRIGFFEHVDEEKLLAEALSLARMSDIVVLVVGKDHEWETETSDTESMDLPLRSNELIAAVAKENQHVVLVNQTGSPITMPWVDDVPTIVQAWYQGQEHVNALADILLGTENPSGKLPITFPKLLRDNPSYSSYPGKNDETYYDEDIYAGYRFYDHKSIEPLLPFGFGLSYTRFTYSNLRLSAPTFSSDAAGQGAHIVVEVDVTNVGDRLGKEVVQFYVSQVTAPRLPRPVQELKGWAKVSLEPGETKVARCVLDRVSLSYFDDGVGKWVIDGQATFEVVANKHSRDVDGVSCTFITTRNAAWVR